MSSSSSSSWSSSSSPSLSPSSSLPSPPSSSSRSAMASSSSSSPTSGASSPPAPSSSSSSSRSGAGSRPSALRRRSSAEGTLVRPCHVYLFFALRTTTSTLSSTLTMSYILRRSTRSLAAASSSEMSSSLPVPYMFRKFSHRRPRDLSLRLYVEGAPPSSSAPLSGTPTGTCTSPAADGCAMYAACSSWWWPFASGARPAATAAPGCMKNCMCWA
mmetsp:Transcript_3615/g.12562  ORF Transcript_3615/g.12562 Transcript_3615/m.12562 type:complete len:215 (-) Transcript_3615:678-1322(-)